METRVSLLEELKKGGYEASLITTFNAYLPFYEDVVLRKLVGSGVRHNLVLMDSTQCQQSFTNHPPRLAGRHYSLLPIRATGAFHPKVILLVGKKKGLLAIGSHNLTLSGFGNNLEVTNLLRFKGEPGDGSGALFQQAWNYIQSWLSEQDDRLPGNLVKMVKKIEGFAPWLDNDIVPPEDISIIAPSPGEASLFTQLKAGITGRVARVIVGGAFFDSQLAFLNAVKNELAPDELIVGIDPETVSAPPKLKTMEGVRVVDASALKLVGVKEDAASKYLHAKFLLIETDDGRRYLASGSANPSAPAWLKDGTTGNIEMMLVRSDSDVDECIEALKLAALADSPPIKDEDWIVVDENWQKAAPDSGENTMIGIAVAGSETIQFKTHKHLSAPISCELLDSNNVHLERVVFSADQQVFSLQPDPAQLPLVATLRVLSNGSLKETFFVHHELQINEQSKTGAQRKFQEALSSLDFSSPDLETFLSCVERIVFTKSEKVNQSTQLSTTATNQKSECPELENLGFAVDVSDTRKAQRKHRLHTKEDLAYLLDILIHHVRISELAQKSFDAVDQMGRNEEEQVGAEDSDEMVESKARERLADNKAILMICHRKVKTLINRMIDNLKAFSKQEIDNEELIVRLTAVLAVLRELRNCDKTQSWIDKGTTTVPLEERNRLLTSILSSLYEGQDSFWQLAENHPTLAETDDVAHLKGLIIWLAWDCKLRFNVKKPLAEKPDEEELRLFQNAQLLAVAQLINSEDYVLKNARQSIGPLCGGDLVWLDWMSDFGLWVDQLSTKPREPAAHQDIQIGDIAFVPTKRELGSRVVRRILDDGRISMIGLKKAEDLITFQADRVEATPLLGSLFK